MLKFEKNICVFTGKIFYIGIKKYIIHRNISYFFDIYSLGVTNSLIAHSSSQNIDSIYEMKR